MKKRTTEMGALREHEQAQVSESLQTRITDLLEAVVSGERLSAYEKKVLEYLKEHGVLSFPRGLMRAGRGRYTKIHNVGKRNAEAVVSLEKRGLVVVERYPVQSEG